MWASGWHSTLVVPAAFNLSAYCDGTETLLASGLWCGFQVAIAKARKWADPPQKWNVGAKQMPLHHLPINDRTAHGSGKFDHLQLSPEGKPVRQISPLVWGPRLEHRFYGDLQYFHNDLLGNTISDVINRPAVQLKQVLNKGSAYIIIRYFTIQGLEIGGIL